MSREFVNLPLGNFSTGDASRSNLCWGSSRALLRKGLSHMDDPVQIWKSNFQLDSLFVVALLRSLSSIIYQAASQCLTLQEPRCNSHGEFLNADRFALIPGSPDGAQKYITKASDDAPFTKVAEFADQVVVLRDFAYKDVVQAFLSAAWSKSDPFAILKVKRNVADVALSVPEHRRCYSERLFSHTDSIEIEVVLRLLRAQDALDSIPGMKVDFDAFISDEHHLYSALASLYGGQFGVKRVKYNENQFKVRAEHILKRRSTPQYGSALDCFDRTGSDWRELEFRVPHDAFVACRRDVRTVPCD